MTGVLAPWGRGPLEWGGIFDSTSRSRLLEDPDSDASEGAEVALRETAHFISDNSTKRKCGQGSHTDAKGDVTYNIQQARIRILVDWDNSGGFVFCLVHRDGKHPVLQFRRNVAGVHRAGKPDSPGKRHIPCEWAFSRDLGG